MANSSLEDKADLRIKDDVEQIEHIEPLDDGKNQSDLSSIEATAASKAAWLISIVVSIGGFLFGTQSMQLWGSSSDNLPSRLRHGVHLRGPGYNQLVPRACSHLKRAGDGDLLDEWWCLGGSSRSRSLR